MNLRDLEYLVAVADEGNFSRAAVAVGVSQPTLSTQVRKLETELGIALMERTSAGLLCTAVGVEVVSRARKVIRNLAEIRSVAEYAADPAGMTITLGLFPTLGPYLLPHLMPAISEQFGKLTLRLVEEKSANLREDLVAGRLDAIILASEPMDNSLNFRRLFRENFLLVAPQGHPLTMLNRPLLLADLRDYDLLLLSDGHCLRDHTLALCEQVGAKQLAFRATSLEALRYMVASGFGVTLMPQLAVSDPIVSPKGLVVREFGDPVPARELYLAWRSSSAISTLLAQVAEVVSDVGQNHLGS